jgi:hypothetical protein
MDRNSKLAELRAKTDRQLVILIRSTLDDGLASRAEAERVYSEVRAERRCLESKLARLRGFLDERPMRSMARLQTACC